MIKFFRKIRQNLLSQGKTGKYFKYAIGEIILVVIGILIALQINNSNELSKQKKEEEKLLAGIKEDFIETRESMLNINRGQRMVMMNSSKLINAITTKDKSIPIDSIRKYITHGAFLDRPSIAITESYDAIIGSGKTSIIDNQKLLTALADFSSLYKAGFQGQARMDALIEILYSSAGDFYPVLRPLQLPTTLNLVKTYTPEEYDKALDNLYNNELFLSSLIAKLRWDNIRYSRQNDLINSLNEILAEFGYDEMTPLAELHKKYIGEYKTTDGQVVAQVEYEDEYLRIKFITSEERLPFVQLNDSIFQAKRFLAKLKFSEKDDNTLKLKFSMFGGLSYELEKPK